ncbi:MAG: tetratricopeptide repeat protein [Nitrospirae bacterium]|nr:tetratricopeptide repeat protein [Nitrospirota bacterium]
MKYQFDNYRINNSFVHIACLVVLILVVYGNTLSVPFGWDEETYIVHNPIVRDLHYFASPSDAKELINYSTVIYRYIGYLTFALNYKANGLTVTGYHIVNIAIHLANATLVYLFVLLLYKTPLMKGPGRNIAFFSALLFSVHPLQTAAVTNVFQRFVPLTTFFYLLSLTAYIKFRLAKSGSTGQADDSRTSRKWQAYSYYAVSFVSAILAMKTKEIGFTLPLVIVLSEYYFFPPPVTHNQSPATRFFYLAPLLLTLSVIPLTMVSLSGAQHLYLTPRDDISAVSRWQYLITEFSVIVTYLKMLLFPLKPYIDYEYPVFKSFLEPQVLVSFIFLSSLLGAGIYLLWRSRRTALDSGSSMTVGLIGFGILWFFITLSVESSVITLFEVINEYRVYLPSVGVSIGVVTGIFLLKEKVRALHSGKIVLLTLILVAGALSVATYLRNGAYGDRMIMWEETAKKYPARATVHNILGTLYESRSMPEKAMEQYLTAIKLKSDYAEAHNNLGNVYDSLNMPEKAEEQYLTAVKMSPDNADMRFNFGNFCRSHNMPEKAIEQYLMVIKLRPDYVEVYNNLGGLYFMLDMPDKAKNAFQTVIRLKPDFAQAHYNLGVIYKNMGQVENARKELTTSLKIKPDYQKARQLLQEISRVK